MQLPVRIAKPYFEQKHVVYMCVCVREALSAKRGSQHEQSSRKTTMMMPAEE